MTKFVLISTQRSGSTWVVDMLESHPSVTCYGALFLPEGEGRPPAGAQDMVYFSTHLADRSSRPTRLGNPYLGWKYVNQIYSRRSEGDAVGFKLMYSQFRHYPWMLGYFALKRIRIVHLVRKNKLDHVLSKIGAKVRGKYHALPGEVVSTPKLHVNTDELLKQLAWEDEKVRRARRILSLLRAPQLEIAYEELAADRTSFGKLLEFLGVDSRTDQLSSDFRKWSRGSYEERIENYDSVKAALAGTKYAGLLREAQLTPRA